jgi:hypothetical protein
MIENIKNPPQGFESIIKRHFYLKKDEILEECKKWIAFAEHPTHEASYTHLVNDHNQHWCNEFKSSKTKYHSMLVDAIKELEKELNNIPAPSNKDIIKETKKKRRRRPRRR